MHIKKLFFLLFCAGGLCDSQNATAQPSYLPSTSARLSSVWGTAVAHNCTDGVVDGDACRSMVEPSPWLELDLGGTFCISKVELYMGPLERILLGRHQLFIDETKCAEEVTSLFSGGLQLSCVGSGRKVRLVLPGSLRVINIREIKVFGGECGDNSSPAPSVSPVSNPSPEPSPKAPEATQADRLQVRLGGEWQDVCCNGESLELGSGCSWTHNARLLTDNTGAELDCPENDNQAVTCFCSSDGELMHGAPDGPVISSLALDDGAPIFSNNKRQTCVYVVGNIVKTRVTDTSNTWDEATQSWSDENCPHWRLTTPTTPGF